MRVVCFLIVVGLVAVSCGPQGTPPPISGEDLALQDVYIDLEHALENPEDVYKLSIRGNDINQSLIHI